MKNVMSKYRQMYSIWICILWFDENMRTPRRFSAIYHIKLSYTQVWKSDLDQLRSWSKSFYRVSTFSFVEKKWPLWLLQLPLLIFFTLIFFRFNMFIWRSIMFYVNAVLIKISVLNSTMTTASTSKFHFPFSTSFYLFMITARHFWASDVVKCVLYKIKSFQSRQLYCNLFQSISITEIMFAFCGFNHICTKINSTFGTYSSLF